MLWISKYINKPHKIKFTNFVNDFLTILKKWLTFDSHFYTQNYNLWITMFIKNNPQD